MNANRIIDMIIRQITRRIVRKGVDKGFDMASRMGGSNRPDDKTDPDTARRMKQDANHQKQTMR